MKTICSIMVTALIALGFPSPAARAEPPKTHPVEITVYKTPTCGCCSKWEDHLRANGFHVTSKVMEDVSPIKDKNRIPEALRSCHTGVVDGLVFEGHVPAKDIRDFLAKKPKGAKGLAVPGMPMGSPGMEGPTPESYEVLSFDRDGHSTVFSKH